jgi:hypothetical protein
MSQLANALAAADALMLVVRPFVPDDVPYAAQTWREEYKKSSAAIWRMPWPAYKETVGREIDSVLATAKLLAAVHPGGRIAGWLAYTPGKSVSTVHWAYTRFKIDNDLLRRRGVMTLLLEAAQLGRRFAYTHRGAREARHRSALGLSSDGRKRNPRGPSVDEPIVDWLRGRGVTAVFVDYKEWRR